MEDTLSNGQRFDETNGPAILATEARHLTRRQPQTEMEDQPGLKPDVTP